MAKAKKVVRRAWTKDDVRTMKTMAKAKSGVARIAKVLKRTPVRRLLWRQSLGYPYRCAIKNLPHFRNYFLTQHPAPIVLHVGAGCTTVLGPRVDDPNPRLGRSIASAGKLTKPKR